MGVGKNAAYLSVGIRWCSTLLPDAKKTSNMRLVPVWSVSCDRKFRNCNFFNEGTLGEKAPRIWATFMTLFRPTAFTSLQDLVRLAWMSTFSSIWGWETFAGGKLAALHAANAIMRFLWLERTHEQKSMSLSGPNVTGMQYMLYLNLL